MKDKIVSTAIRLFNKKGIVKTTFRDVGDALGLSDGHIRYYVKTKDQLLCAILEKLNASIQETAGSGTSTDRASVSEGFYVVFCLLYEYRFIFLESPETFREFKQFNKSYQKIVEQRKVYFLSFFEFLQKTGVLSDKLGKTELNNRFEQIFIFSEGWIRYMVLTGGHGEREKNIRHIADLATELVFSGNFE